MDRYEALYKGTPFWSRQLDISQAIFILYYFVMVQNYIVILNKITATREVWECWVAKAPTRRYRIISSTSRSSWVKAIEAAGALVQVWPVERAELADWIKRRAAAQKLKLTNGAAEFLAEIRANRILPPTVASQLPGVAAAHTDLPVIGVPLLGESLGGLDSLLATVQMPPGVPVACVAVDGARNAGILAARMINN